MSVKKIQEFVGAKQDGVIGNETLTKFMRKMGVTRVDTAHFFGNIHHESGGFTIIRENMNYSAKRLLQVFPKYFTPFNVNEYVGNPEAIGNRVYGNRMGNSKDEGYKFRGRGAIQCTGKNNYSALGDFLGVDLINNPDLVADKYWFASAIWFFTSNKLWGLVSGVTDSDITKMRKRINGGINGLDDVRNKVKYYYNLIK